MTFGPDAAPSWCRKNRVGDDHSDGWLDRNGRRRQPQCHRQPVLPGLDSARWHYASRSVHPRTSMWAAVSRDSSMTCEVLFHLSCPLALVPLLSCFCWSSYSFYIAYASRLYPSTARPLLPSTGHANYVGWGFGNHKNNLTSPSPPALSFDLLLPTPRFPPTFDLASNLSFHSGSCFKKKHASASSQWNVPSCVPMVAIFRSRLVSGSPIQRV